MFTKKKYIYIIILLLIIAGLSAFVKWRYFNNPLKINVNSINLNVEVERFDLDVKNMLNNDPFENIKLMEDKYGDFFELYNAQIIDIGEVENLSYFTNLSTFLSDYSVLEATKEIEKVFPDLKHINEELTDGFKHWKYYFPDYQVPRVLAFVAGFNQSIVTYENFIGIGLDKYLGADCYIYDMLAIANYARFEMAKEQIPVDVITALAKLEYTYEPEMENLLNQMIYNGKILYFLDAMFPEFDEARKNKYTNEQLEFCYKFEKDMWTSLIEDKQLFVTDYFTIRKYTENAPFTFKFGQSSPPRAANWIGLQIVRAYMKHNDVSLQQLMQDTNYQLMLNKSGYSPK
jgi:hypothetical protein